MAYVPPHKRHSKDADKPSPKPELLAPKFQKKMTFGPSMSNVEHRKDIISADDAVYRWFTVGSLHDSHGVFALRLELVSIKATEDRTPLMLVRDKIVEDNVIPCPWDFIADHVMEDLLSSYENLKKVEGYEVDEVLPKLVARFGKVIFLKKQSPDTEKAVQVDEPSLRKMKRLFHTNVPVSYVKYVTDEAVSKVGLAFEEEKELYHVKLRDSNLPDCTISCKCRVKKDLNRLELCKLEINQMRHMVADVSCVDRDLDLRLMLCSKKFLIGLTEEEKKSINSIIDSAVIDPSVKGGLRWSLGQDSSGERYTIIGVWHTISKSFTSPSACLAAPSVRLRVRHADRVDFRTSTGEVTQEVTLKMDGILSQLREKDIQSDLVAELLKNNMKLIWDCFLCCDSLIN